MTHRLAVFQGGTPDADRAYGVVHGTGLATARTGVRRRQPLSLLLQQVFDGALGQTLGSGNGQILHSGQIDVQPRPIGSEGVAGDDFSPLFGERAHGIQIGCTQVA
jgi:hypothetical protein